MKKVVSIFVCLLLLTAIVLQSAFASTPELFGIKVGNAFSKIGHTVKVPVSFTLGSGLSINNIDFRLAYDSNSVELQSVDAGDIVTDPNYNFSCSISNGKVTLLFFDETLGKKPITKSGVFANLNFRVMKVMGSNITFDSLGALNEMDLNSPQFTFTNGTLEEILINPSGNCITPYNIKVDKSSLTDVSVAIKPDINRLTGVKNGASALIKDTDYTISGSNVTIKKSYLNYYFTKFPEQNLNLDFLFKLSDTEKLCIYTGTSSIPVISPSTVTYNVGSRTDVPIRTELNGNYISSILTIGNVSLLPRIDYTFSVNDGTTIIRKSFLETYFKSKKETSVFGIIFTGGSSSLLDITPVFFKQP